MIIALLVVLGLCAGSFVNALVWRVHEQAKRARHPEHVSGSRSRKAKVGSGINGILKPVQDDDELSILHGRSMCIHCKHILRGRDLIPVLSWVSLQGRCRYCKKPISAQYPLVELATGLLFVASYVFWPYIFDSTETVVFGLWLLLLTGLMALLVYDLRWMLLPNRIIRPLGFIALVSTLLQIAVAVEPLQTLADTLLAVLVGGGIFYVLFQVSKGKWIGGGDVKLGWLLGLIVATPARSMLVIFLAALLGTLVSLPLLATKRLERSNTIPFGPFLIVAAIITQLFGHSILLWYQRTFLGFTL